MQHYIYKTTCKETGEYYIGKRSCPGTWEGDVDYRGSGVLLQRKMAAHPEYTWIKLVLILLDSAEEALENEAVVIGERYVGGRAYDGLCLNLCAGGRGIVGYVPSEETRAKQSEAMKGRVHSAETREKIGEASRGRTFSEETRQTLSEAQKGNKNALGIVHSAEGRARIGAANRNRSAESRAKMGVLLRGCVRSAETRAKMSASHIKDTVNLVSPAGTIYEVNTADIAMELSSGAEFTTRMVDIHNEALAVWVHLNKNTAKSLILLNVGWQVGKRKALRKVGMAEIDKATGLLKAP